jgi:putative tryptophan/tyrosine transport system substrate-binding protein
MKRDAICALMHRAPGFAISRRRFLSTAGLAVVPIRAHAQAVAVPRIGYMSTGNEEQREIFLASLREGLRELGWTDGRNIVIDVRWAGQDASSFPKIANDLVRTHPSAIVSTCIPSTRAAKAASATVPVVMSIDGDPVDAKLIASFARPGGNVTGTSTLFEALIPKWIELIKFAVPSAHEVALVSDPDNLADPYYAAKVHEAARRIGVAAVHLSVRSRSEIAPALMQIDRKRVGAAVVMTDALLASEIETIVPLVDRLRLPAVYGFTEFVEAGGLMSYGFSFRQYYRRVARYIDAVLRGAKPAELPVEQPTKIELVVNRAAADRLGLTFPPQLLVRADRVIR